MVGEWIYYTSSSPQGLFKIKIDGTGKTQLSQNFIKEPSGLKLPLRLVLTSLVLNFLAKPDFIAYNFSHTNNIFNRICIKLWKLQPVVWIITSEEELTQAQSEDAIAIFERYLQGE